MKALIKAIAVAVTLAVPAVLADAAIAAGNKPGFHRDPAGAISGAGHQRLDVGHRVRRHSGHRYRYRYRYRYRSRGWRGYGARRSCQRVQRVRITRHGRRVRTGAIMCYDNWGRPYLVAGSRHVIR